MKLFVVSESVVSRGVLLGVIITKIGCSRSPKTLKLLLVASILHPVEAHVDGLGPLLLQFFLSNSLVVLLSTCILVGCCWCNISMRVFCSGTVSCAFIKDVPISSSAANAMTFVII